MIFISKWIFILILIFTFNQCKSQGKIKEKIEISFMTSESDSLTRYHKTTIYDKKGREIRKLYYYYHLNSNKLKKEEKSYFDSESKTLTEHIINYPSDKEPVSTKLITKYLEYELKEENSKRLYRQLYDDFGDISREDTLIYNSNNNLIERCSYDYRGNTSLFCHYYSYNNKGLQNRWKTYSKWTTINGKGEVAERKAKRRDYRFRYNKRNELIRSWGKHYLNRYKQKLKYDNNGKILENNTVLRKKLKVSVNKSKKGSAKKYKIICDKHIIKYKNGRIYSDIKLRNNKETNKKETEYRDSLPYISKTYRNSSLTQVDSFEYNKEGKILKKISSKFSNQGLLRYTLTTHYNKNGQAIKEEQKNRQKILSMLKIKYDSQGNPVLQSLSMDNNKTFEKTMYIYKYY